jgi:hypothetical protein
MTTSNANSVLTLSASDLRNWQTCRRRYLLEQHWRVVRWRPASLFRSCLREGVLALSNGADVATVRTTARTRFLSSAANPGLDHLTGDPWTVAQDWAGMLGTVLTAIARLVLLTLTRPASIPLSAASLAAEDCAWLPLSWLDDSGTLHRWLTCDHWTEEVLAREAHSWHVIGDMVMLDAPMMLHAIEIGQQRNGRRHSPWARCYKHPLAAGGCRFQRPDGAGGWRPLSGKGWKPLWYVDQTKPDPEAWVDLMDADHVTPSLLHHTTIAQPSAAQAGRIRGEIGRLAREMRRALADALTPESPMEVPMARAACDPIGGPCPLQVACFSEDYTRAGIASSGLYQIRGGGASARSSRRSPSHADTVAIA